MFSKPHKKGNDGARSSMFNARPTLPKTLENAYLAERHAEAVARHINSFVERRVVRPLTKYVQHVTCAFLCRFARGIMVISLTQLRP